MEERRALTLARSGGTNSQHGGEFLGMWTMLSARISTPNDPNLNRYMIAKMPITEQHQGFLH